MSTLVNNKESFPQPSPKSYLPGNSRSVNVNIPAVKLKTGRDDS